MALQNSRSSTEQISHYLRELDLILRGQLNCPLYNKTQNEKISNYMKINDSHYESHDEDQLIIAHEQDKKIFNSLKHFILPSSQRLALFEWLLEQYEPGIFKSEELAKECQTQTDQIEMLLREIGVVNYSNKLQQKGGINQNTLDKSIEGLNGTLDSLQLLVRLAKFVVSSKQVETIDNRSFQSMNDKLMNYICTNQKQVFQNTVRLFPPGFPKSELFTNNDHSANMDQLSLIIDDLSYKVENTKKKISDLNAKTLQQNQGQVNLASKEDVQQLRVSLENLKEKVSQFNDTFEESMKRDLSKVAQNQIQTQLGKIVNETSSNQEQFDKITTEFQDIIEKLGRLQIKLQMIGLNEENNYKREDNSANQANNADSPYKTFTYDPQSSIFIDQEHNKYAKSVLNDLNVNLDEIQTDKDKHVLFGMYTNLVEHKLENFTAKAAFDSAIELGNSIAQRSSNVKECRAVFTKGQTGKDSASMIFNVTLADRYLMIPYLGYYQNPGLVQAAYIMKNYSHKLGGLMKPFEQIEFGYRWAYIKDYSQYYFIQEFKPFSQYNIRTQWSYINQGRTVEQNVYEDQWKSSFRFIYDLNQKEEKTNLFKHSFVDDPEQHLYLKLSRKNRQNRVATNHSSRALMENALGGDQLYVARLGLKYNQVYDDMINTNCFTLKASQEVASNYEDTRFIKTKMFTRYQFAYQQALFQTSLSAGYLKALQGSRQLKCNDNFYLKNFKGVRNIGYYYDQHNPVKGLSGENLGFDKYIDMNFKISQLEMPLFKDLGLKPFINFKVALAPNKYIEHPNENIKTFFRDYSRASVGLGLSLQLPSMAIECYFSPLVYRQKNEIKADFQINIGID